MERWLPIPDYVGLYEVSSYGRVRSVDRQHVTRNRWGTMQRVVRGKLLVPYSLKGYPSVKLYKDAAGKAFRLSRLVLTVFDRLPASGEEACHENHDTHDNCIENLSWGSRQENEDQKTAAGRRPSNTRVDLNGVVIFGT